MGSSYRKGEYARVKRGKGWWWLVLALAAGMFLLMARAEAAQVYWAITTPVPGDWNVASNWTPAGQPQNGDSVYIGLSGYGNVYYYNSDYPNAVLNELVISGENISGGYNYGHASLIQGHYTTNQDLASINETLGVMGMGYHTQTAGTNTSSSELLLGVICQPGGGGLYSLSGSGSLSAPTQIIGYNGTGTFNQTGGSNSAANLTVGTNASGVGTYTHSAGTNQVTDSLYLGYLRSSPTSAASGTYNLSDSGNLSATNQHVGYGGTGTFNQTGGSNSAANLTVGTNAGGVGTYTHSAGTNQVTGDLYLGYSGRVPLLPQPAAPII